jgi:hypothetical protein
MTTSAKCSLTSGPSEPPLSFSARCVVAIGPRPSRSTSPLGMAHRASTDCDARCLVALGYRSSVFARPFRFGSVLALIVAYASALVLAIPVGLLLPRALLTERGRRCRRRRLGRLPFVIVAPAIPPATYHSLSLNILSPTSTAGSKSSRYCW